MRTLQAMLVVLSMLVMLPVAVNAQESKTDPVFEAAVARIRASMEKDKSIPSDPSFYAPTAYRPQLGHRARCEGGGPRKNGLF
jgi:hypothetical protein